MQEKSKVTAYVLWLMIGAFGAHRFYLGRIKTGIAMAVLLMGTVLVASIGGYILVQSIEDQDNIQRLMRPSSPYMILSFLSGLMFIVWAVWYLLDLIFIHFMMKSNCPATPHPMKFAWVSLV